MIKTPLDVRAVLGGYLLLSDYVYEGKDWKVTVPKGFFTDFASVPRLFRGIISRDETGIRESSVLHDYLYSFKSSSNYLEITRAKADRIFLQEMIANGAPVAKSVLAYYAVHFFGQSRYKAMRYG